MANGGALIPPGLVILGFGGHARSVADVALHLGFAQLRFVDANSRPGESFAGFPATSEMPDPLPPGWMVLPAAGDNSRRCAQFEEITLRGWPTMALVAKTAHVGYGVSVEPGSFVASRAHLGPMAAIGRASIINTHALVEHECTIGSYSHVAVNATIAGRCKVGDHVFVGAGATVIDGIRVADRVVIGAGATVVTDIVEPGTYVGCPARRID